MPIPLEDTFADIVGKAMRGQKLADSDVAARASVNAAAVQSLRDGTFDEATEPKPRHAVVVRHIDLGQFHRTNV